MNIKEMHIDIMQSTQKIASNRTRTLFPQEIDWLLNKQQNRLIDSKVTPKKDGSGGFEVNQFDVDSIRNIIKSRVALPALLDEPGKRYKAFLPGDYRNLLSDISAVQKLCGTTAVPEKSIRSVNLLVVPLFKSKKSAAPYYTTFNLTINGNVEFNVTTYTQLRDVSYTGYNSVEEIYELRDAVLHVLLSKGFDAYWEQYAGKNYPGSLIVVSNNTISGSVTIDTTATAGVVYPYSEYTYALGTGIAEEVTNRLTATHKVDNLNGTPFYETQADSPLSELVGNQIAVHVNENFIVSNLRISYVRKPRKMSLILGHDCELNDLVHPALCDLVVEYYKAMIQDPNWEVKLKDNMIRTQL